MTSNITETQFRTAAQALLPAFIELGERPYRLDAHGLMAGSWRISYCNGHLDADARLPLDEIWEDPLDCIKAMRHRVCGVLGLRKIDEQAFEAMSKPFRKSAGLADEVMEG